MFIPLEEPDWFKFVLRKRRESIVCMSRYKGVSISLQRGKPKFLVRYRGKGYSKCLGLFPLSQLGEEMANAAYQNYIKKVPPPSKSGRIIKCKLNFHDNTYKNNSTSN